MRLSGMLAIVLALLLAAGALLMRQDDDAAFAHADSGVIDLRGHDFNQTPVVSLEGSWDGCTGQLLAPLAYADSQLPACNRALRVPGRWHQRMLSAPEESGAQDGKNESPHVVTLHLRLRLPATATPLALRLVGFFPANRVWINGRLAGQTGRIATLPDEEIGDLAVQAIPLPVGTDPLDVVVQASNFSQMAVGSMHAEIGAADIIDVRQIRRWTLSMASAGVLLLMCFYHVALYAFRRSEAAPLYLGLNALLWVGTVLCMGISEWPIRVFVPDAPGEVLYRVSIFCLLLASAFAYQFFRTLYPQEFPRWIARLIWLASLVGALIAVAAPVRWLTAFLPVYSLLTVARLAYSAWALALAARRRRPGAAIVFCGYFLMLLLTINDWLNWRGIIHTQATVHLGMIVYMFSQALALALRFSLLHAAIEKLSTTLEKRNRALADEVAERSRLQHDIVSVSEDERRRMSRALHDGLCQQLTGARLQCAGLAQWLHLDAAAARELAQLSALLGKSVDHAYDLAHGAWPMDPESDDAVAALGALVRRQHVASAIAVELQTRGCCAFCRTPHAAHLVGIAREALGNAVKHAGAARITLTLDCSDAPR